MPTDLVHRTSRRSFPGPHPTPTHRIGLGRGLEALKVLDRPVAQPDAPPSPTERVRQALAQLQDPVPVHQLQRLCGIRTATICSVLAELAAAGQVVR